MKNVWVLTVIIMISCNYNRESKRPNNYTSKIDTSEITEPSIVSPEFKTDSITRIELDTLFIFNSQITGFFNQDSLIDTLIENLVSKSTMNKIDEIIYQDSYEKLVESTCILNPDLSLKSSHLEYDLKPKTGCQTFGFSHLINIGNQDNYPGDEIAFIIDHADFSNLNSCYISSYRDSIGWVNLFQFDIHEMTLYQNQYIPKKGEIRGVLEQEPDGWYYCKYDIFNGNIWKKLSLEKVDPVHKF